MSNRYSSSDYAGLSGGGFSFYYGYEELKDDDWAFVMRKGDKELVRFSATELGLRNGDDPTIGLLAGIEKSLDYLYSI
jgi:hypothetical protein